MLKPNSDGHQNTIHSYFFDNIGKDTYMELSGIELQKIDPSFFDIPEDYTEVDDRM